MAKDEMVQDCIFCKIQKGIVPATKVYEDEEFFCIRDIQPQSKVHLLLVPRVHVQSLEGADEKLVGKMFSTATKVARAQGLLPEGFRSVINTGPNAGQSIFHLHVHLLGGEPLGNSFS